MAHFARVGPDGTVLQVIVISNDDILDEYGNESQSLGVVLCESVAGSGLWVQTSYNGLFRRHYAGLTPGILYRQDLDAFILPQPYPSWLLDLDNPQDWTPPVPMPDDSSLLWVWDEQTLTWVGHERQIKPPIVTLGD